jgi:hypothetical protein
MVPVLLLFWSPHHGLNFTAPLGIAPSSASHRDFNHNWPPTLSFEILVEAIMMPLTLRFCVLAKPALHGLSSSALEDF